MDTKHRYGFRPGDLLAVGAVLLLAAVIFVLFFLPAQGEAAYAQVYQNGRLLHTLSLAQNREVTVTGEYRCTVTVKDGSVAVTASDCPGEDCVHSGWIRSPGRSIVCLPNGLELRVVGETGDVDFVVR